MVFLVILVIANQRSDQPLLVRGAFNRDALSWCFLSTGIGLVLLSCLRSLLEVGRSIIVLEQRSRQQRGDAMHN